MRRGSPQLWDESAQDGWKPHAALVALSCAALALAAVMRLWWGWDFQYSNPNDIRGWVWANRYPKQQEIAAYCLAVGGVATGAFASRWLWCVLATGLQSRLHLGPDSALRGAAAALSAAVVATPIVGGPAWSTIAPLGLPLAVVAILTLPTGLAAPPPDPRRAASLARLLLAYLIAPIAIYWLFYDGTTVVALLNLFEDGAMLAPLQESLRGGTVYRDSYLQHGLFHNLGKPLLASVFEVSLTSFRAIDALFKPFAYLALYVLGVAVFRSAWTALALTLIFTSANLQISDRQSLGLLSVAMIAFALRREAQEKRPSRDFYLCFAGSGICTTLAFFYSTEIGIYAAAACGGFAVSRALLDRRAALLARLAPAIAFGSGAILAALPFLGYFLWHGVLLDFVANTVMQCTYQAASWGRPFDSLAAAVGEARSLPHFVASRPFRAYLAPAVYLATVGVVAFRLARPGFWKTASSQTLLLLALAGLAWFRTALGRFDPHHLGEGTPFLWVIVFLHAEHVLVGARNGLASARRGALLIVSGALLLGIDAWVLHRSYGIPTDFTNHLKQLTAGRSRRPQLGAATDRLGAIEQPAQMVADLRAVVQRIRELTDDGDFIFDFTNQGALYFLADRRSPWRYHQVVHSATPTMDLELIDELEAKKPRLVVFESAGPIASYLAKIDGVSTATRHPQVVAYLQRSYHFAEDVAGTVLLLRNEPPGR